MYNIIFFYETEKWCWWCVFVSHIHPSHPKKVAHECYTNTRERERERLYRTLIFFLCWNLNLVVRDLRYMHIYMFKKKNTGKFNPHPLHTHTHKSITRVKKYTTFYSSFFVKSVSVSKTEWTEWPCAFPCWWGNSPFFSISFRISNFLAPKTIPVVNAPKRSTCLS